MENNNENIDENVNETVQESVKENVNENVSQKDWLTSLILCLFLGFFGIHRIYVGKLGSGFLMLYGTIVAACILGVDIYLGAIAFVVMGAFVLNDFLNILFKCFKDCYGKEVTGDTALK